MITNIRGEKNRRHDRKRSRTTRKKENMVGRLSTPPAKKKDGKARPPSVVRKGNTKAPAGGDKKRGQCQPNIKKEGLFHMHIKRTDYSRRAA